MTCHHARQLLAAYRRDDWTSDEMRALAGHLAMCASCRQVEAAYRQVGESVRMLPTVTPDPSLREAVYAAITAERRRFGPAEIIASRAETEPSLPVVRAPVRALPRQRTVGPVARAAMGIAAALILALFVMQLIPGFTVGELGANLFHGTSAATTASRIAVYTPDAQYRRVQSLRSSANWVAYAGANAAGANRLFVINRRTSAARAITYTGAGPIAVDALTSHWVVWSDAASGWTIYATPLSGATVGRIYTIASATNAQIGAGVLTGVWADDSHALFAVAAPGAAGALWTAPLDGASAPHLLAHADHANAVILHPALVGKTVVWEDVWADATGALRGTAHGASVAGPADQVFGLSDATGALVWVSPDQAPSVAKTDPASLVAAEAQTHGAVYTQHGSQLRQLDSMAVAGAVQTDGAVALWTDGSAYRLVDLRASSAEPVATQLATAQQAELGAGVVAWYDGAHISVYTE